ncbi:hypothetical protein D3C72_783920 [compost metagenome]
MVPAQKRFETNNAAAFGVVLLLVIKLELVIGEAAAHGDGKHVTLTRGLVHGFVVKADRIGSTAFCPVHGDVSLGHQRIGIDGAGIANRYADTCADRKCLPVPFHRLADLLDQSLGEFRAIGAGIIGMGHRHEFIAAHARQELPGFQHGTRAVGDGAQHGVARRMAMHVIDFLETVEIDRQKRGMRAQRDMSRATIEMLDECRPVGNARQRIVQRKMTIAGNRLLGGLGVDDIGGKPERQKQQRHRNGASAHDGRRQQIFRNDDARVKCEGHRRHAGIMHRGNGEDEKRHRAILAETVERPGNAIDRNGAEHRP